MAKIKKDKHYKTKNKRKKKLKKAIVAGESKATTILTKKNCSSNWITFSKNNKGSLPFNFDKVPKPEAKTEIKPPPKKTSSSKVVAIDCEMVSTDSNEDMLARVSVVDFKLQCIYDKFVTPTSAVGDYRTRYSGIRPKDLENAEDFKKVQDEVKSILKNKILVGHSLSNDFNALKFGHHKMLIRDTARFYMFREVSGGKTPALKTLAKTLLKEDIQQGEHSSVEDARAAMKLYIKYRHEWESYVIKSKAKRLAQQAAAVGENDTALIE